MAKRDAKDKPKPKPPKAPKKPPKAPAKRKAPPKAAPPSPAPPVLPASAEGRDYDALKERSRARNAKMSATGRDIWPCPPVRDLERREYALQHVRNFCETYFPMAFCRKWSDDHIRVTDVFNEVVHHGGMFGYGMPRGFGKTTLCVAGVEFSIFKGMRRFPALIGCDKTAATEMLDNFLTDLETNDLLFADFPEMVYPVRCIDGIQGRCPGQTCQGERTRIELLREGIVFPILPPAALRKMGVPEQNGCGAIMKGRGLLARIRGMNQKLPDGSVARPDLFVLDDPQTDASAASITQTRTRMHVIDGAVMGMAGHDTVAAAFMPCTVIFPGDMADQMLNPDLFPDWQGIRTKMLYALPSDEKLWDQYAEIRRESLKSGNKGVEATEFYSKHHKAMDAGAVVAWPECFTEGELSAVQHAMNIKVRSEEAFWAEAQNEPLPTEDSSLELLTADEIAAKVNGLPRGMVPMGCDTVTAFVDVGQKLLWYVVAAFGPGFPGGVIDYGTYPDQERRYFTGRDAKRTLRRSHPGTGAEGAIFAGLEKITGMLLGREWVREDGAPLRIQLCLIDAGYKPDVVHQFCRQSRQAALLMPSLGRGISASMLPVNEFPRKQGERFGFHWWMPALKVRRALRHVVLDVNYWKMFVHERLRTAMGDKGCVSLFGERAPTHRLLAEHLTAERPIETQGRGRTVVEWKLPPSQPDNHWFDGFVGCAAAASIRGVALEESGVRARRPRKPRERRHFKARKPA